MSTIGNLVYGRPFGRWVLAPVVWWGQRRHERTGRTPGRAYSAMRKLHGCADPAPFARAVERSRRPAPSSASPEVVGIAAEEVEETLAALEADGCAILTRRLDEGSCAALEVVARAASCALVDPVLGTGGHARFDDTAPRAVRYDVDEGDILAAPAAQRLVADPSLLAIATRYLGAEPVQDLVAMWWSAASASGPSSAAAQQFHFDLDRLQFLKVFVYLTDVDDEHGPHVYVKGSHRNQPAALRRDGRQSDEMVDARYPGAQVRIVGSRETVFLADTRGLHKGLPLIAGHRLVFQLEYATSLFGAPHTRPDIAEPSSDLADAVAAHPWTYQRFHLGGRR